MDLVLCSLEDWDDIWRRNQFLAAGLLRRNAGLRILFVEPAQDPAYMLKMRSRPRFGAGLKMITTVPEVGSNRLWTFQPTKWLPRSIDKSADIRLAGATMRAVRELDFDRPVLWINNPSTFALLQRSGWPALYDITDDWLMADRSASEHRLVVQSEVGLLERCAVVTVCSPGLKTTKGVGRPVKLVPNAVDVERYRKPRDRPSDLPPGKIALYVGTAHPDRIDVDLCERTARLLKTRGAGSLVLVGGLLLPQPDRQRLADAGIVALGPRPNADVPAYMQHAEVLVVPHVVSDFTDSLDPIKLYEYRAVGRPIVSTPVAGFREGQFPEITAVDAIDFPQALLTTMSSTSVSDGPAYVAVDVPDWSERVASMAACLDEVAASR